MMTGWHRGVLWTVATAAGLIVVGLTLLLWLKNLGTAGTVAGFVADTAAIVMVVLTVRALLLQSGQQQNHTTASGPGAVAAGRSIGRAVTGKGNQVSGRLPLLLRVVQRQMEQWMRRARSRSRRATRSVKL